MYDEYLRGSVSKNRPLNFAWNIIWPETLASERLYRDYNYNRFAIWFTITFLPQVRPPLKEQTDSGADPGFFNGGCGHQITRKLILSCSTYVCPKSKDAAVIRVGCSATNFPQTTLLSPYMAMTAKFESRSVAIVFRNQNDISTSILSMGKMARILRSSLRLRRRCCLRVVCSVRRPRWIHNPTLPVASSGSFIETVPDFRKMTGIASDGPTFFAELLIFCDVAISHNWPQIATFREISHNS